MRSRTVVVAALMALAGSPWLVAQQPATPQPATPAAADQVPAFKSGVELVSVDVGVIDRQGLPVRGLGPSDFTVTVAGVARHVVTAEFVDASALRAEREAHPELVQVSTNDGSSAGHLYVFIVDQGTLDMVSARNVGRAATRFLQTLTPADRSALVLLPIGQSIPFTWAHDRIRKGLEEVTGLAGRMSTWEYGSLTDARDIANHNPSAMRNIGERQCGSSFASFAGPAPTQATGTGATGTSSTSGNGTARTGTGNSASSLAADACARSVQMQAESAWREVENTSQSSMAALRQTLIGLARLQEDKTIILISGGWPLNQTDEMSAVSDLAMQATAARATVFTVFAQSSVYSSERRNISLTPNRDRDLHTVTLESLAAMTGGASYRADAGGEGSFDRMRRELGGYYRIGVQKDPTDVDGKSRRLKIQVARNGLTVRARDLFDVRTYEDRDWAARLGAALESPVPATSVGLRVTSYTSPDPQDPTRMKLVLTGDASRLQPGPVNIQVLLHDQAGAKVTTGALHLDDAGEGAVPFSIDASVPKGSYVARVAVIDGAGRVGSVDHHVDVKPTPVGSLTGTGPLLVRVSADGQNQPQFAVAEVHQSDRLALEVDLDGAEGELKDADVTFEITPPAGDRALINTSATLSTGPRSGTVLAQGVADMRVLPPGAYVVHARVVAGGKPMGELSRAFNVLGARPVVAATAVPGEPAARPTAVNALISRLAANAGPVFALDEVLTPAVRNQFLDRVAGSRETTAEMRPLIDRARGNDLGQLDVPAALASKDSVAAFLSGLSLLSQNKLEPAAAAFRTAMRASPEMYSAMVYLGACYAGGGKDKEAVAAWRTALIREGDTPAVHGLLAGALLRQGNNAEALRVIEPARDRWPDDQILQRTYVVAALKGGAPMNGLDALDELSAKSSDDEPTLALGLQTLYEAFSSGHPIQSPDQDRTRMLRLADAYRSHGGPSQALIDAWIAAVTKK